MNQKDCKHNWVPNGLWSGRDSSGRPTGGKSFKCEHCGKIENSELEIRKRGEEIVAGTDVFVNPITKE
jgi:ribosomal protein L27